MCVRTYSGGAAAAVAAAAAAAAVWLWEKRAPRWLGAITSREESNFGSSNVLPVWLQVDYIGSECSLSGSRLGVCSTKGIQVLLGSRSRQRPEKADIACLDGGGQ